MLHLDPSSVGHPDKRWLKPHCPTATAPVSRATSCRSSIPVCHKTQRRVSVKVKRLFNRESIWWLTYYGNVSGRSGFANWTWRRAVLPPLKNPAWRHISDGKWWKSGKISPGFEPVTAGMIVQYLARQTRCPKIRRHTPDKTRLQSGQGSILVLFAIEDYVPFWSWMELVQPAQLEETDDLPPTECRRGPGACRRRYWDWK